MGDPASAVVTRVRARDPVEENPAPSHPCSRMLCPPSAWKERSVKHDRRPHRKKPSAGPSLLERINPNAAGIDCGSDTHHVAVPSDRDATPVRAFQAFTAD